VKLTKYKLNKQNIISLSRFAS